MENQGVSISDACEVKGTSHSHEAAWRIVEAEKAEICSNASPLVGGSCGGASAYVSVYQRPAIVITERVGEAESTIEFATAADYKAWKELQ